MFEDKELTCACGKTFILTAGQQDFFQSNGLSQPKRCEACRRKRRAEKEAQEREQSHDAQQFN